MSGQHIPTRRHPVLDRMDQQKRIRELTRQRDQLMSALESIKDTINMALSDDYLMQDDWNPDAHHEVTLVHRDVRQVIETVQHVHALRETEEGRTDG